MKFNKTINRYGFDKKWSYVYCVYNKFRNETMGKLWKYLKVY